jgi:hypothetical protein
MVSVNRIREFLAETKTAIPDIDFIQLVVDDSELEKFMKDRPVSEKAMLFAVMPEFQLNGSADVTKWNNQFLFFIVVKTNDRNLTHDKYLDVFSFTQQVVKDFVYKIVSDKQNDSFMNCSLLQELDESSIVVSPVWGKAQCNGWMIAFDLFSTP